MEIVDAQVHLNNLTSTWRTDARETVLETGVETMQAVGVDAVLIAESLGFDANKRILGETLPNGAIRVAVPFSELAMSRYPERFGYLYRVDPRDPELDRMIGGLRARPGALAMRIVPLPDTGETDRMAAGEYQDYFAAAEKHQVPVFCFLPARSQLLVPYLEKFPAQQFILDHCGVGIAPPTASAPAPTLLSSMTATLAERVHQLDQVLDLARYPNLSLKWCHAPSVLSGEPYPHRDVMAHLRRAITAFGAERIMWASDYTQARTETGTSWGNMLYYLRDSDELSETEKEWLLGRTVRQVLRWPQPSATGSG